MMFRETEVEGAFVVEPEKIEDERGFFARTWSSAEFEGLGLDPCFVQCNLSFNKSKGTLRGIHFQVAPHSETKLVRCTRGRLYDVAVDLREGSATFLRWTAVELSETNHLALYIPKGAAHGFQTLEDGTEVSYQMSEYYVPEASSGVRWNDPAFGIEWPLPVTSISNRDRDWPDFERSSNG